MGSRIVPNLSAIVAIALHPQSDAFGKVILLGEHSVVHGYPALAAGLPQSLVLTARPLADPAAPIRLSIPGWNLDLLLDPATEHLVARAALEVLVFADGPITGWHIEGSTRLPAQAGLGSSAALTVALARLVLGGEADLEDVVSASLAGERVFHGEPSGLDSHVAARGGFLRFVRGEPPQAVPVRENVPLTIVPSKIPRSTADQVAKVRALNQRLPRLTRPIFEVLGTAVAVGVDAISRNDLDELGVVMSIAHELLSALGVSSPALDELCSIALQGGARGAKLTGAGGGGCIIALPGPNRQAMSSAFRLRGLEPIEVSLAP